MKVCDWLTDSGSSLLKVMRSMNQVFVVKISVIYLAKIMIKFFCDPDTIRHKIETFIKSPPKKAGKQRATAVSGFACNSTCSDYREMDFQKEMSGFFMHSVVSSPSSVTNLNATMIFTK